MARILEKKIIINKIKLFKNVGRVRSIFPLSKLNCFPFSFQMAVECIIDLFINIYKISDDIPRLMTGRWFTPATPVSSTNKTDRYYI